MRRNKSTVSIIKKYYFLIAFAATFAVYLSVMCVQAAFGGKKAENPSTEVQATTKAAIQEETTVANNTTQAADETLTTVDNQAGNNANNNDNAATTKATTGNTTFSGFVTEDDSYLNGALFIGDSRTVTLASYAGWDKSTFFVETGLTIWTVMDANIASVGGSTMSVDQALSTESWDKIYIMLGINELGRGTATSFADQYKTVLDRIHELQPQAVIYLESIMHVTQSKDDQGTYINNDEVNARNTELKKLADNRNIFWLDVNEVFDASGTGKLNPDYTSDGVHLKPMYIPVWQDYLLSHVVKR